MRRLCCAIVGIAIICYELYSISAPYMCIILFCLNVGICYGRRVVLLYIGRSATVITSGIAHDLKQYFSYIYSANSTVFDALLNVSGVFPRVEKDFFIELCNSIVHVGKSGKDAIRGVWHGIK